MCEYTDGKPDNQQVACSHMFGLGLQTFLLVKHLMIVEALG